jgi:hypothetical protein
MMDDGTWMAEYSIWQVVGLDYGAPHSMYGICVAVTNSGVVQNKFLVMRCLYSWRDESVRRRSSNSCRIRGVAGKTISVSIQRLAPKKDMEEEKFGPDHRSDRASRSDN